MILIKSIFPFKILCHLVRQDLKNMVQYNINLKSTESKMSVFGIFSISASTVWEHMIDPNKNRPVLHPEEICGQHFQQVWLTFLKTSKILLILYCFSHF